MSTPSSDEKIRDPGTALGERSVDESALSGEADRGVTLRVVAVCLGLAVLFGIVVPIIDVRLSNTFLGATHLPPGAIAVLFLLLMVANPLLRTFGPRLQLSRNEMLVVYISCLFSCLVPGHGAENGFVATLIGPFYFATRENNWLANIATHLPSWFSPAMEGAPHEGANNAVQEWYTGSVTGGVPWASWAVPVAAWLTLIVASYIMLACLSVLLRAQWSGKEALAFPLLQLPLEMTDSSRRAGEVPLMRNGLLWVGCAVVIGVQLLRGLHRYNPDFPDVPLELDLGPYLSETPWNQLGWTPLNIYPLAVGIAYLLTGEVSLSLWAFYWIIKAEYVVAYFSGNVPAVMPAMVGNTGHKIFTGMQVTGAYFAYAAIVLWLAREQLHYVARRAFGRVKAAPEEAREALSYPVAFWGLIASLSFCIGWCVLAGVHPLVSLWIWGCYLVIAIGLSRVVAEGGLLFVQQGWVPLGAWAHLFGAGPDSLLRPASMVPGSFVQAGLMTDLRGFLMPSFVQSFKLAYDRGIEARKLLALIAAVTTIGLVMGVMMNIWLGYAYGGLTLEWWFAQGGPKENASNIATLAGGLSGGRAPGFVTWFWFGAGAAFTLGMLYLRARFTWFPLHPLGYLVCLSYAMNRLWFSIFLGWFFKTLITRFAGTPTYRSARPLFLGMALGDVLMMLFWLQVDAIFGRQGHQLMPS